MLYSGESRSRTLRLGTSAYKQDRGDERPAKEYFGRCCGLINRVHRRVVVELTVTLRPHHRAQECNDATLRLPREMRKTTSRNSSNGMWPGRHKDRPWERRLHRSIQDPGLASDSLVATWLPPSRRDSMLFFFSGRIVSTPAATAVQTRPYIPVHRP